MWFIRMVPPSVWQAAVALGVGMGLSLGLSLGSSYGLRGWPLNGLSFGGIRFGLIIELSNGLNFGLIISVTVVLIRVILARSIGPLHFAERIHWTWRGLFRPEHLRTSLHVVGALFLFLGLSNVLSFGPSYGLSFGLSFGLSYWIVLGLYQGMKQEHLKLQDRRQFNQGIRRSMYNGLLISLISAIIISVIGVLSYGLSYGLNWGLSAFSYELSALSFNLSSDLSYGLSALSYGLSYGLSYAWILFLTGTVVMWALSGGITVLRHYVIRWLLARHRIFPWHAQAFLDDATSRILLRREGGGYSFIHRRLQDYFADTSMPSQN